MKAVAIFGPLLLTACVASDASVQTVGDMRLSIRQDDGYYWPAPTMMRSSTSAMVEVEPFPLVSALVVSRSDGAALTDADKADAHTAASAHCRARSLDPPSQTGRLADGAWAFYGCTTPTI